MSFQTKSSGPVNTCIGLCVCVVCTKIPLTRKPPCHVPNIRLLTQIQVAGNTALSTQLLEEPILISRHHVLSTHYCTANHCRKSRRRGWSRETGRQTKTPKQLPSINSRLIRDVSSFPNTPQVHTLAHKCTLTGMHSHMHTGAQIHLCTCTHTRARICLDTHPGSYYRTAL